MDCPTGDDPQTAGVPEIQIISCKADSGYLTLSFRQYTTDHILFDDDIATLKAKLEVLELPLLLLTLPLLHIARGRDCVAQGIHTIHGVTITSPTGSTTLCGPGAGAANQFAITFTQDFGNLPALKLVENALAISPGAAGTVRSVVA